MSGGAGRRAPAEPAGATFAGPPVAEEPGMGALTLPGLLAEVASRHAEREALVFHEADGRVVRWSYRALEAEARRVARALLASGVGRGSRVGLLLANRPEFLAAAFGASLTGAVAVLLSTFSTPRELEHLLRDADVGWLLLQRRLRDRDYLEDLRGIVPELADASPGALHTPRLPYLRGVVCLGLEAPRGAVEPWEGFLARGAATEEKLVDACAAAVAPADPALLLYSSGSTALPKGMLHAQRGPCLQSWRFRRYLALDETVRFWSPNGFFWSGNFAMVLGGTLTAGGCIVLQEAFEPGEALRLLEAERVTTPHAWPHQLARLEEHPGWEAADLSSLRHVDPSRCFARHPRVEPSPGWSEGASYGLSETFTIVAGHLSDAPLEVRERSTGPLFHGTLLRILDPRSGEPLSAGQPGEIAVKGATMMLGYLKRLPEEYLDRDGFLHTGDAGWMDEEGHLHWTGRLGDIIKTGGVNVSPAEIEGELAGHPGVKVGAVVGVPHDTLGEMVVACVVASKGEEPQEAELRAYLRERLAAYKVPRRVLFVEESELALTGSAKIRLADLRELAQRRLDQEG